MRNKILGAFALALLIGTTTTVPRQAQAQKGGGKDILILTEVFQDERTPDGGKNYYTVIVARGYVELPEPPNGAATWTVYGCAIKTANNQVYAMGDGMMEPVAWTGAGRGYFEIDLYCRVGENFPAIVDLPEAADYEVRVTRSATGRPILDSNILYCDVCYPPN